MIDVKGFKKISSDSKTTTLRHPDGHEIRIAHAALSPKMKAQVAKLPQHLSDGGEAGGPSLFDKKDETPWYERNADQNDPASPAYIKPKQSEDEINVDAGKKRGEEIVKNLESDYAPLDNAAHESPDNQLRAPASDASPVAPGPNTNSIMYQPQAAAPVAPVAAPVAPVQGQPASVAAAPADPYGYNALGQGQLAGIGMQQQGLQQAEAAQAQQGVERQRAAQEHQRVLADLQANYQQKSEDINKNINDTLADIKNDHIDPKHYLESMGAGQKIATAIGLMAGGLSSAKIGGENPAMKFLNEQINRDVNSQVQNLGKKENVLGAYYKQYGNLQEATAMARATQLGIYSDKLDEAAAKAAPGMAQATLLQNSGLLKQQKAQIESQLALHQTVASSLQGAANNPATQIRVLGMARVMPPEDQKEATKELGKIQEIETLRAKMHGVSDQLGKKFLAGALSPNDRDSFVNTYGGILAKAAEGRFNLEESKQQMRALLPSGGESDSTRKDKVKNLDGFFDALGAGVTPTLQKYPQIKVPKYQKIQTYAPQVGK